MSTITTLTTVTAATTAIAESIITATKIPIASTTFQDTNKIFNDKKFNLFDNNYVNNNINDYSNSTSSSLSILSLSTPSSSSPSSKTTALLLSRAIWLALQKENIISNENNNNSQMIVNDIATKLINNIANGINQTFINQTSLSSINENYPLPITSRIEAAAAAAVAASTNPGSSSSLSSSTSTSTSTTATTEEEDFYRHLITIIAYSLIIIVSLCGNSLVLKIILAKKNLQTTTNILIAWLAVSDLLTTTLNIPFNVARFIFMNYPFPALFCKLVPFIQVMCVYVSTFTMGVIALHRYMTVTSATKTSTASRSSVINAGTGTSTSNAIFYHSFSVHGSFCLCIIMTIVWILAGLLATPHSMFNQIVYVPYQNRTYVRCRAEYPQVNFNLRLTLSVEAFLTQYLMPLGMILILYIKIGHVVAKQGRIALKANSQRRMEQDSARRRRLAMLILIVAMFGICWMPLNLYHLLVDFHLIIANFNIFLICHWIAMSSVCWNPFIYCWLNESFRKGATKIIIFICCCCCPQKRHRFLSKRIVNEISKSKGNNNIGASTTVTGTGGGGSVGSTGGNCIVAIGIPSSPSSSNTLINTTSTTIVSKQQKQKFDDQNDNKKLSINYQNNRIDDEKNKNRFNICNVSGSINDNNNENNKNNQIKKTHNRKFYKLRSISLRKKNKQTLQQQTIMINDSIMSKTTITNFNNENKNDNKIKYKKNISITTTIQTPTPSSTPSPTKITITTPTETSIKINEPIGNNNNYNDDFDQKKINNKISGIKENDFKNSSKTQQQSSTLQQDFQSKLFENLNDNNNNNSTNDNNDKDIFVDTNHIVLSSKTMATSKTTTIKTTFV